MLKAIVQFSLRFRGIVVTLAYLVMGYGLYSVFQAKLDVFPDFVPPEVTVQAEAPGLSAEQVETLVTLPLENQLNGLGNQKSMRSESIQGLSVITIVFEEGTPILPARQLLAEKLNGAVEPAARRRKGAHHVAADFADDGLAENRPAERQAHADGTALVCELDTPAEAAGGAGCGRLQNFWRRGARVANPGASRLARDLWRRA